MQLHFQGSAGIRQGMDRISLDGVSSQLRGEDDVLSHQLSLHKCAVASTLSLDKPRLSCSTRLAFRCMHTILHSYAVVRQHNHSFFV